METLSFEDMNLNPHRLSHCGKIIFFHCQRADGDKSELMFRCLSFERGDNTFLNASHGAAVIKARRAADVDIVECKCVINIQQRITTPCVLVAKKGGKSDSFHYLLLTLSGSDTLEPCFEFKLPYEMREGVSILQGPTVTWRHAGDVFYTSPRAGEVRQVPIHISHSVVGEITHYKDPVFVLGLQKVSEKCSNNQHPIQTVGYFLENGQMFDGTVILPYPYICITRCMLVLSAKTVDGVLKTNVVAATSNQQLVYFESGTVKDVCELPFEQPESIQAVNTGRNGFLFVISFHQGHVCAVWKDTCQVASCWSDVTSVHVDDFLGCGTDQILLFFKEQGAKGQPLETFILTDLCGISFAHCQDNRGAETTASPQENQLLTLKALESRLQSGMTVLQELQREVSVKERVLQQSIQALTGVVSGKETIVTQPEQEGLVALWDGDDDETNDEAVDDKTREMPATSPKPHVDKLWHRIAEDRMVVGVILTADSSIPVASVSLSILTETGQSLTPAVIQTQSQVLWLPAPCTSSSSSSSSFSASTLLEPAAKKSRQHNGGRANDLNTCRLAVTAVTGLTPLLNSGSVKCRVTLHYVPRGDAFALLGDPTPVVLHCGQVALDIYKNSQTQLLKTPELKTDEALEDLLSLMALLDHWVFHVHSPDHSLGDINGWIEKRVGCKRIEVYPQYLLLNSSGPSALLLLHWHQITPFQGELSVHSSQLQMLKFLDSLMAHLPASCSIQPVKGTRGEGATQIFSLALEKEAVALRDCVSSLLCEEEEEKQEEEKRMRPEAGGVEGLQRCREVWQRDVERSRRRLSPLVDVERYRRLTQSLSRVQLHVDLAALLDTQRTLHG